MLILPAQRKTGLSSRDCVSEFVLRHTRPVGHLAWSPDNSILSTSTDNLILLWNTKVNFNLMSDLRSLMTCRLEP